jgi:hypothetical protein
VSSTTRRQRLKARASHHLTAGYTPEFVAMVRATKPGQAHWAGTGPAGKTCGQCDHLGYWAKVRNSAGDNVCSRRRTGCAKFFQLTGNHGAVIPPAAGACRHFQPRNEATKQGRMK